MNINKAQRIIAEESYYKKPILGVKKRYVRRLAQQNGYIQLVAQKANIKDGLPCARCNDYIAPWSDCYVKYRHNHTISIPTYYHEHCFESLFQ